MAISEDVQQIIRILQEEDFGALAGELLAEISLGRAIEKRPDGRKAETDLAPSAEDDDAVVVRVPFNEDEQLPEAIALLRLRLAAPIRAFAEAERIAGNLTDSLGTRIRFIDPETRAEVEPISRRDLGDGSLADDLDALLLRLPDMRTPPTVTEV